MIREVFWKTGCYEWDDSISLSYDWVDSKDRKVIILDRHLINLTLSFGASLAVL